MDLSALLSTLLSDETVNGVGGKTNASPAEVRGVLGSALPLLLNGANAQAVNEETASGFAGALQQHAQSDTSNLTSFLGGVDLIDGGKIVAHLLGLNTASQTQTIAQQSGVSSALTGGILSAAAPLLMSLLGQQANNESSSGLSTAGLMGNLLGSGDMTSLLGNLLGGNGNEETLTAVEEPAQTVPQTDNKKKGLLGKLFGLLK